MLLLFINIYFADVSDSEFGPSLFFHTLVLHQYVRTFIFLRTRRYLALRGGQGHGIAHNFNVSIMGKCFRPYQKVDFANRQKNGGLDDDT